MPRYDAQEASHYFEDGRAMRPPVEGTMPQEMIVDLEIAEGIDDTGSYVMTIPQPIIRDAGGMDALLARGHGRFDIYCSPCHAYAGDGQGMITRRAEAIGATFAAANLHDDRIRHLPDGQVYATIANGIRTMPAYRAQIPVADRWAIVAYLRALQLSQSGERSASLRQQTAEPAPTEAIR
ncbi:MAG: cytochrome c [Myxococcota bacterium]|nr:cytochrome c [Myxococcota bacterium]